MLVRDKGEERLDFLVQESTRRWRKITFEHHGRNLKGHCTCDTGKTGEICSHQINLMNGVTENLLSDNPDDVTRLTGLIRGTKVEGAMSALKSARGESKLAKAKLNAAKMRLARALQNG